MATVIAVSRRRGHHFSKMPELSIRLVAGHGVEGDGHAGATVKHRSRVLRDPAQPNLRQVHLLHGELFDALRAQGFSVNPGDIGENILTRGVDLLGLPTGTRLQLVNTAMVELTGLRNPCIQLNRFLPGLLQATLEKGADGQLIRKSGVMAIVCATGDVHPGDPIVTCLPPMPHQNLAPV